ncbi:MAG: carbohydrate ABC transporter permease [Eubacteriales bacterium]
MIKNPRTKKKLVSITCYSILILLAAFIVIPIMWMVLTSFKTEAQTYSSDFSWLPNPFTLEAYEKFFQIYNFGKMTLNSMVTCAGSVIICTSCAALAGYGVTRFKFTGRKQLMEFLLITQMFPSVMLVVPFYAILSKVGMTNSLFGLIIVYSATNVAFSTWMLVSYFKTIPIELDEAAKIDGAGSFRIFWSVVLPLVIPGLAAVALFVLFHCWNEYMYSSVLISSDNFKTLTVGIISLNTQDQVKWNDLMAAATFSTLPLSILFVCFQNYFIAGMTGGAVKS